MRKVRTEQLERTGDRRGEFVGEHSKFRFLVRSEKFPKPPPELRLAMPKATALTAAFMPEWENQHDPWAITASAPRDALASLMQDRGVSQYQLEKAGGVAQSTLSQILAGECGVSESTAKKLAAFFGVSSVMF